MRLRSALVREEPVEDSYTVRVVSILGTIRAVSAFAPYRESRTWLMTFQVAAYRPIIVRLRGCRCSSPNIQTTLLEGQSTSRNRIRTGGFNESTLFSDTLHDDAEQ